MKSRKFNRKLVLNKKTISNLSYNAMHYVNGGKDAPADPVWPTDKYTCFCPPTWTVGCCTQGTSAGGACC